MLWIIPGRQREVEQGLLPGDIRRPRISFSLHFRIGLLTNQHSADADIFQHILSMKLCSSLAWISLVILPLTD